MYLEHGRFAPYESAKSREGNIVFAPPTTVEKLPLNTTFLEPNGLSLFSAPIYGGRRQLSPNTTEYTAIFDYPLTQEQLFTLMDYDSPNRGFGIAGVIADLKMPDMKDGESQALQSEHLAAFNDSWIEFEKRRKTILEVLINHNSIPEKKPDTQALSYEAVKEDLVRSGVNMQADRLGSFLFAQSVRETLAGFIKKKLMSSKNEKFRRARADTVFNDFLTWDSENRATLLREFLQQLDPLDYDKLTQRYINFAFSAFVVHFDEGDKVEVYLKHQDQEQEDIESRFRREIQLSYDNWNLKDIWSASENWSKKYHAQLRAKSFEHFLRPLLRWETTTVGLGEENGCERNLILDFLPQHQMSEVSEMFLPDDTIVESNNFDTKRLDALVGLLVLKYFSPEIPEDPEKNWPKKMPLHTGGNEFPIGPAQMSILALMIKDKFSCSKLLPAIEKHIETNVKVAIRHSGDQASPEHPESPTAIRDAGQARLAAKRASMTYLRKVNY